MSIAGHKSTNLRKDLLICIVQYTVVRNFMITKFMKLDTPKRKYILLDTNASVRPPIPESMKREVRQRCGFGCVICGMPLYTYEHMLGYVNVDRHVAEELTLLCYQHQYERTQRKLPLVGREAFLRLCCPLLLGILYESDQATHLCTALPWIHQM